VYEETDHPAVLNEEPGDPDLGCRQERMIVALLEHPTHEKAAAALGISTVTLWRAMQKPEFAEAFRKARREAFSQSVARLQHASNAAVGTLLRVMTDREAPAASRVRAADVVLQTALRGIELEDLEARLDRLERSAEASNGGRRY
jgi:hypothetical protein